MRLVENEIESKRKCPEEKKDFQGSPRGYIKDRVLPSGDILMGYKPLGGKSSQR